MNIYTVELTNHCNAKCEYCPHPFMKRNKGFMTMETYEKVLAKQKLDFVELHGFGESLLHPQIFEFIKMAKSRGFKARFSTNGLLLNRDVMEKLADAGLNTLWISIRPFFDEVKKKMEELHDEFSKKMEIIYYYVEFEKNRKELPKHWKVEYVIPHTWSSMVDLPFITRNDVCCNHSLKAVSVLWDGRVANCCHDVNGEYILGTIDYDDLKPKVVRMCGVCEFNAS